MASFDQKFRTLRLMEILLECTDDCFWADVILVEKIRRNMEN